MLPVGASQPVQSDFRIISATHQNLPERVTQGAFRHDLYFRLITFEVEIPSLSQRRDDIPLLAAHFLGLLAARSDRPAPSISQEAMDQLQRNPWHGNVRELRNAIEHAMVLARSGTITPDHLPDPMPASLVSDAVAEDALDRLIRQWTEARLEEADTSGDLYDRLLQLVEPPFLRTVMQQHHGQCATAARVLGMHRTTLRKKLDQLGIDDD